VLCYLCEWAIEAFCRAPQELDDLDHPPAACRVVGLLAL
jgi:hypothetical protein